MTDAVACPGTMTGRRTRHNATRSAKVTLILLATACAPEPAIPVANDVTAATPSAPAPPPPAQPGTNSPPAVNVVAAVDGEGLRLVVRPSGATRPIPFGTPRADTLAALAFRGPPGTGTNDCGNAYAAWPDGLTLNFQKDALVGWALDGRSDGAITTMSGIGTSSTRAELEGPYAVDIRQTTLGTEFTAGTLAGLLDGTGQNARITNMWAGATCIAR